MNIPVILWILIIFLGIRLLFRWLAPILLPIIIKRFLNKHGPVFNSPNNPNENSVTDKQTFNKPESSQGHDDEYIDFEELK
jgi:hypothetical protein